MKSERNRNLVKYILPSVLGNCAFFLFGIVDAIFLGNALGANAVGALNLCFPFMMGINAVFMLMNIGGITIAAIRFGRGDKEGANKVFMHSVSALLAAALVLCMAGVFFTKQIALALGANDTYFKMLMEYLFWYSLFIVPSGMSIVLQGFCRNDGSPVLVSAAVIIATSFNIASDWLLIFPLKMGLKGAAIATGLSQTLGMSIVLSHYLLRKGNLRFRKFRLDPALFGKILKRGLPETIAQFAGPVAMLCTNYVILARIGNAGLNAFALIGYVSSFSVAVFFGTSDGLQPLFGQSYGAGNEADLKYYFHAGIAVNLSGSIAITAALLLFLGRGICALFGVDRETLSFTMKYMPRYAWGFVFMSLNVLISSYLYSTKRTKEAFIINALRSFVFNIFAILALPLIFGGGIIWYTFGIYEGMVLFAAVILLKKSEKNGIVYR